MSEMDVLASNECAEEVVFHEQLVEPIQLTLLYTPQLHATSTTVTPSPTLAPPAVTSFVIGCLL